jgi:alpha-D-xyloside xylohydrolase
MKRTLFSLFVVMMATCLWAQDITETKNGVKVNIAKSGICEEVIFYSPSIVRVVKYPATEASMPQKKSYSVIMSPQTTKLSHSATSVSSDCITVDIDATTGAISFADAKGNNLLKEKTCGYELHKGDANDGKLKVNQSFTLDKDEAIFGLGQRKSPTLNQRGEHVTIWSGNTNITIPYFTSVKGYGLYWDNAGMSHFDDDEAGTSFSSEVATMEDYYFMYRDGTQDGVMAQVRALTGQATMFPLWAMGHFQSRERYKSSDEVCNVLDKYRTLQIPLDCMVQDWQYWGCDSNWNAMRFMNPHYINKMGDKQWFRYLPYDDKAREDLSLYTSATVQPRIKTPQDMISYLHRNNAHLMISIWANFGPWTQQYKELEKIGALLPFETWPMKRGVRPYDVFNPKARDIYWKYLEGLSKMGIDAWWTDSSEPDHFSKAGDDDYKTYDGTWLSVKNAFPLLHNMGIYEHQRAMKGNNTRAMQMTRCGAFGLQHYGTFSWSGDINSSWDEMQKQVPSGLNYVICGIPYWNTDIGGFFGWDYDNNPKSPAMQELQVRWMQWGCFTPLMRNHCSSPMVDELYEWGKPGDWAYDVQKKFITLRYRLLPYTYSNAGDVVLNSGSMMRPLVMDFAKDKKAINLSDEYLFGRNILVKPVTQPLYTWKDDSKQGHLTYPDIAKSEAAVKVYLPEGTDWFDFWTNERLKGGKETMRACPITLMPVYVRAGSIIPFGPAVQYAAEKQWDNLEIRVYPGADGTFTLYEDDGNTYNYEKGAYSLITFQWNDAAKQLTIADRRGSYKGMITARHFDIVLVGSATPSGDTATSGKTVEYTGKSVTVDL